MTIILILFSFLIAALVGLVAKNRFVSELTTVIAGIVGLVGSVVITGKVVAEGSYQLLPYFMIGSLETIVILLIAIVGLISTIYSVQYLRQETIKNIIGLNRVRQYFILLNLFLAAMFLTISVNSPILMWISIEATTLTSAFLISFYNKPSATEAAWKYLIINSIGLLLGFLGTLLYFTSINSGLGSGLISWQALLANATSIDPMIAKIAFVFVLIGYGTKVGLAPMHTWLPDAHSNAPAPISALLSGVLLNIALVVVLKFKVITDAVVGITFSQNLLIIFGLFSIIIAALIVYNQKNYKRLLAYSSIENMGIITLGFGFGGMGIYAGILHMIYHSLIKSSLFLTAGTIFLKYSSTKIVKVRGVLTSLPLTSILFLTGFMAITGTPPFGIFLSKIFILSAGITTHPAVTITTVIFVVILFIGFFRQVVAMMFGEKPAEVQIGEISSWLVLPPLVLVLILIVLSLYIPPFLLTLINNATTQY
jgi:hydrogenase-4 component F